MFEQYTDNIELARKSTAYDPLSSNLTVATHALSKSSQSPEIRSIHSGKWWKRRGWPVGALGAAFTATFALIVNLIVMTWALSKFEFKAGVAEIYTGNCHKSETINTWVHLGINFLGTLLLSGSNYCMQVLSAPTRREVDKAHEKSIWLDIGVPSVRNLRNVSPFKVVLWVLLGISSLPLHLLFNSVMSQTIASNDYDILFATDKFVGGGKAGDFNTTKYSGVEKIRDRVPTWERLSNSDCINAYATEFLSGRRAVVAVVDSLSGDDEGTVKGHIAYRYDLSIQSESAPELYGWICDASDGVKRYGYTQDEMMKKNRESVVRCPSKVGKVKAKADDWYTNGFSIRYCLSEVVEGRCSVNFNLPIIVVVIISNASKAILMFIVAFRITDIPLITVGDAIDSFTSRNDPNTKDMCLTDKERIKSRKKVKMRFENGVLVNYDEIVISNGGKNATDGWETEPIEFKSRKLRWNKASSKSRWYFCIVLFCACMIGVSVLLFAGIFNTNARAGGRVSSNSLINLGLGAVHSETLISGMNLANIGGSSIVASVLVANAPQPVLSFIYFLFNGVFTSMLLAAEWAGFSHSRKRLRVSNPRYGQRSTYFLQLPYRYAVPLMILSGVLHWSVSQSLFLAQIVRFNKDGGLRDDEVLSTCGYSIAAIIITMVIGTCLTFFVLVLGIRKFPPGIPLAGSCSAAIAAACHVKGDVDTTAPLLWGAIAEGEGSEGGRPGGDVGHCAFSDLHVSMPTDGRKYQGSPSLKEKVS